MTDDDRRPHRDWTGQVTRPGVHVGGGLDDTIDDEATPLPVMAAEILSRVEGRLLMSPREREIADAISDELVARVGEYIARARHVADAIPRRLAVLELHRAELDKWRLALTGVADRNGRIGELHERVDDLHEALGGPDEAKVTRTIAADVRAIRRRLTAAALSAAAAIGVAAWGLIGSHDAGVAAAARLQMRLDAAERQISWLLDRVVGRADRGPFSLPQLEPGPTP